MFAQLSKYTFQVVYYFKFKHHSAAKKENVNIVKQQYCLLTDGIPLKEPVNKPRSK